MTLLDTTAQPSPPGWAIATAGVVAALLDKLIANGTITGAEGQQIVADARKGIGRFSTHNAHGDALSFLDVLSKKFPST